MTRIALALIALLPLTACNLTYEMPAPAEPAGLSSAELLDWSFAGMGGVEASGERAVRLYESEDSKGVMIISPEAYGENVSLSYEVKALNPESVLVAVLSLSDIGGGAEMTIPPDYDGALQWLIDGAEGYFFAFHNKAHNFTPLLRELPMGEFKEAMDSYDQNFMRHEMWYEVTAARNGNKVWLDVDGYRVVEGVDETPRPGGHLALRLRGIPGGPAACEIKNVVIR